MTRDRARGGQRTGAALAAAFVAIGAAAAWLVVGAGVPEPPPLPASAVASEAPASAVAVEQRAATPGPGPSAARARAPAAVRSLRLRFFEQLGARRRSYAGPLHIAADGAAVLATTIADNLPFALDVPGDAATLRVEAPGFVACELALDVGRADARADAVRDAVLVPDSSVCFQFVCRPGVGDATIRVQVVASDVSASREQAARAGVAEPADVPMLRGQALWWSAQWKANGQACEVHGDELPLASGEHRRVLVDFAAVRLQRNRVIGPSPELMPHLVVVWDEGSSLVELQLAGDGCFERSAALASPVHVRATGTMIELVEERGADAIAWRPPQPLLGVGFVDAARADVSTVAVHPAGRALGPAALVHVFARGTLPHPLGLQRAGGNPLLQFAIDAEAANDLVLVTAADALAPTRLVVELTGEQPAEVVRKGLTLSARGDGAVPIARSVGDHQVVFELARGGDYTLAWQCACTRERDAMSVHVEAGRQQVVTLAWPAAHAWTGEVAGYAELPAARRWHRIGFGDAAAALHRIDERGSFQIVCFADDPPREPAMLGWGLLPMTARIVACDDARHHVVVQPAGPLCWVDVEVEAPRPWRMVLCRRGADGAQHASHVFSDRQQLAVPVAPTAPLFGVLLGGEDAAPLAWCELRGDATRVTVRPEPLRRVEVRASAPKPGRQFCLIGPEGQCDLGHDLATTAPLVLQVPATTRGIVVYGDGVASREILLGAGEKIVID